MMLVCLANYCLFYKVYNMCVLTKIIIIIMVKLPFGVVSSSLNSVSCHNESGLHLTLFDFDQWKPDLINGYVVMH